MMKFPIYGKIKNVPNHQPVGEWVKNQSTGKLFWSVQGLDQDPLG
jgi:hypothetical protein